MNIENFMSSLIDFTLWIINNLWLFFNRSVEFFKLIFDVLSDTSNVLIDIVKKLFRLI